MKKKISIIFAATAIIAVMAVNFQANENSNNLSDVNLELLLQNTKAFGEGSAYCASSTACPDSTDGKPLNTKTNWFTPDDCCAKINNNRGCTRS